MSSFPSFLSHIHRFCYFFFDLGATISGFFKKDIILHVLFVVFRGCAVSGNYRAGLHLRDPLFLLPLCPLISLRCLVVSTCVRSKQLMEKGEGAKLVSL